MFPIADTAATQLPESRQEHRRRSSGNLPLRPIQQHLAAVRSYPGHSPSLSPAASLWPSATARGGRTHGSRSLRPRADAYSPSIGCRPCQRKSS